MEKVKAAQPATDTSGSTLLFGVMKPMSRAEIMTGLPNKYTTDLLVARYFNSYDPVTREYSGLFLPKCGHCSDLLSDILHGPTFQAQVSCNPRK